MILILLRSRMFGTTYLRDDELFQFFFKIVIPSGFGEVDHELTISGHVPHQNSLILQVLAHFHP